VRVPKDIIEEPKTLTSQRIETEANAEVRRAMIELYGFDNFLRDAQFNEIHRDDWGILYEKKYEGDPLPIKMVKVINATPESDGTRKEYVIPVVSTVKTAHEAVASTFGREPGTYHPEKEA
jgi:hypothetical protein